MFRFTTLLVLTLAILVGISIVPSANAAGGYVVANNQTDLTVQVTAGEASCTIFPHSAQTLYVDFDVNSNVCVHAESQDGSKHWEETARATETVYLNP